MTTFNTETRIFHMGANDTKLECRVTVKVEPDHDFDITDFEDSLQAELQRDIDSGKLEPCTILVQADFHGVQGIDVLGGVLVESDADIGRTIEEHDMVNLAIDDLKAKLESLLNLLKKLQSREVV